MVKRYNASAEYDAAGAYVEIYEADDGRFVAYDDYAALQAESERLKEKTSTTIGVGDGSGSAFVHGDYDSIKILQGKLLELERLKSVAGYTAADVATAADDGFRDGARSVDLERFRPSVEKAKAGCVTQAFENYCNELLALIDAHKGE